MITLHQTSSFVFLIWFHSGFASSPQQYGSSSVAYCSSNSPDLIVFPTIVGGVRAGELEFRHMAALGFGFPGNWSWLCGGSLISEYYVLTVAHCLRNKNMQVAVVRLGTKNIINPESTYMDYNISQRIPHPSFRGQNYNDIALLRLSANVVFTRKIFPACLYVKTDFNDSTLTASGWGGVANAGETSSYLLKVDLVLYNYTSCNKTYGKRPKLPRGIDPSSMICAGGRGYQSKDICHGDSGGPLQISNGSYNYLVGLSLNGISCGIPGVPSLYTKVSAYIGWIEDIVWQ